MEKLIEQEQEKPTKTRADKRTRRKNSFFSDAVDKLHKKDSSYRNISYFRFLLTLLSVIIGALALRSFIVEPTIVDGESMQTTLMDGERVLVEKVSYWFNEPQRGDIVIVRFPNRNECFVKRIIAFGGETIEIRDGFVYIDGKMLDETEYAGEWYGKIRPSTRHLALPRTDCEGTESARNSGQRYGARRTRRLYVPRVERGVNRGASVQGL